MAVTLITLDRVKKHLRVTHAQSDEFIQECIDASIQQAKDYLNKEFFETQAEIDAAIAGGKGAANVMLVKDTINSAIALFVEYRYYGVSALGADKLKDAGENLLHPDRFLVGW